MPASVSRRTAQPVTTGTLLAPDMLRKAFHLKMTSLSDRAAVNAQFARKQQQLAEILGSSKDWKGLPVPELTVREVKPWGAGYSTVTVHVTMHEKLDRYVSSIVEGWGR